MTGKYCPPYRPVCPPSLLAERLDQRCIFDVNWVGNECIFDVHWVGNEAHFDPTLGTLIDWARVKGVRVRVSNNSNRTQ